MNPPNLEGSFPTEISGFASETIFLQILNAMPDMILVKGPASKIIWANHAFRDYYGKSNEELSGMIDADFNRPDYTAQYLKDDEQVFVTGQSVDIPEEPVTRHDGVVRIFHCVKSPIFDSLGKVVMSVGISRDITEKLRTRAALESERVRSMHSSKMATVGEIAAGVAHEVNTPLAIIHGLSGQLLETMESPSPDQEFVTESLRKIESTAMRISRIVTGLNKFARDSTADAYEWVSITQLIDDVLSFSREKIAWHGIQLELPRPSADIGVECNPTLIGQVLLNLLTNARDAAAGGSSKWIRVEAIDAGEWVELSVIDSGEGVKGEMREKIFAPFFTTKAAGKGTGLGLSVSRNIVEAHGGTLDLDGRPGPTRFVVRLPKTRN